MKYPDDYINKIICGDCLEVIKGMPDNSIDTIITDPPYGLSFMGKKWDYDVPSIEIWQECLRVLKPGGTMLCFAGSRTQHRMAVNVEDAGFILKDCIMWLYGSGFPKATDISKQIDKNNGEAGRLYKFTKWMRTTGLTAKQLNDITGTFMGSHYLTAKEQPAIPTVKLWGKIKPIIKADIPKWVNELVERIEAEREVMGKHPNPAGSKGNTFPLEQDCDITAPATPEATLWDGWKSHGLKPAYEPILVAIKPNEGSYANNALKWGVAGLNIDGGRIGHNEPLKETNRQKDMGNSWDKNNCGLRNNPNNIASANHKGRFPANIILDEEAARLLDEQSGVSKSIAGIGKHTGTKMGYHSSSVDFETTNYGDTGGASRFFYCAKASKSERNRGCEGLEKEQVNDGRNKLPNNAYQRGKTFRSNTHPTVKPLSLMKYLVKLTLMPNIDQVYLDLFCGSGTTLMACKELKRDYIGIDNIPEYCEITRRRIKSIPETLF